MEHPPLPPNGGERSPEANSYGTDDPEVQARIEQARREASEQRRRDRARLEQLVEQGMSPDDAETLIEFEHYVREQRERAERDTQAPELAVAATSLEAEPAPSYRPRIYVESPASQELGTPYGQWIDANLSTEELSAAVWAVVPSPQIADNAPWTIRASDAFAGLDLRGFTDLARVAQLARGVAEHGAAYAAYVQIVGTADHELLERFDDFYVGSYASPETWAREVGADLEWDRELDRVVDPMLRPYVEIDYARFARDQRQVWDIVEGADGQTHVFMR